MKDYFPLLVFALVIALCSPKFRRILGSLLSGDNSAALPFHTKFILTSPEYKFYMSLKPLVEDCGYIICPKVGLKDLFEVNAGTKDRQRYFGRISQKHVDFLICDSKLRPIFAIELDDKSHRRADVKERDQFKDTVFKSAKFPLYRVPTTTSYAADYIKGYVPHLAASEDLPAGEEKAAEQQL